jgi:hypothetical protein
MPSAPPTGAPVTMYSWITGSPLPCGACQLLTTQPSLTPRDRPHALCICVGDVPMPFTCAFQGRLLLESNVEMWEEELMFLPEGGTRQIAVSNSSAGTGSGTIADSEGTVSVTISGTETVGGNLILTVTNPHDFTVLIMQRWENRVENWLDTVRCTFAGQTFVRQVSGGQMEERIDRGQYLIPVVP